MHTTGKLLFVITLVGACLSAQDTTQGVVQTPQMGLVPGFSYNVGDFETISTANGNVHLKIPLAKLPPDRGGAKLGVVNLVYNSQIWQIYPNIQNDPNNTTIGVCKPLTSYTALQADQGGWNYGYRYGLNILNRVEQYELDPCAPSCSYMSQQYLNNWRYQLTFPDGSTHDLAPIGVPLVSSTADGYYNMVPDGQTQVCGSNPYSSLVGNPAPLVLYTTDNTFAKVYFDIIASGSEAPPSSWHILFKDGSSVYVTPGQETLISRNGVATTISTFAENNGTFANIYDSVGRGINLAMPFSGPDTLAATAYAANSPDLVWTISWSSLESSAQYRTYDLWNGPGPTNGTLPETRVVSAIQFPTQAVGGLGYAFHYNESGTNGGSLTTQTSGLLQCIQVTNGVATPNCSAGTTGATAEYLYTVDEQISQVQQWEVFRDNTIFQKQSLHDEQVDTWNYTMPTSVTHVATTMAPDGAVTTEYQNVYGYPYRTLYPDLSEIDRVWKENYSSNGAQTTPVIPNVFNSGSPYQIPVFNPFASLEFHTIPLIYGGSQANSSIRAYSVDLNGNQISLSEYDYVATSALTQKDSYSNLPNAVPAGVNPARTTTNSYYFQGSCYCSSGAPPGILDLVQNTMVSGSGPGSYVAYCYDHLAAAGQNAGNIVTEGHWDSTLNLPTSSIGMSCPTISGPVRNLIHSYDNYGNQVAATDALGNPINYTFGNIPFGPSSVSGLYPTSISYADGESDTFLYDVFTGTTTAHTDPNNISTRINRDSFGRSTNIVTVDRTTNISYTDSPSLFSSPSITTRSDLNNLGDQALISTTIYDALGRAFSTQSSAPGGNIQAQNLYYTGSDYRVASNPYQTGLESSAGWTCTHLDALGRVTGVTTFSGNTQNLSTNLQPTICGASGLGTVSTTYSAGTSTPLSQQSTVTDEWSNIRVYSTDGLGRLIKVGEDPSGNNYTTSYTYDALDNLTSVNQNGVSRTFNYDSLKRLSNATNPESGMTCYGTVSGGQCNTMFGYDANGNLLNKTDARGVVTTYTYDNRNRLTSKSYSVPSGVASTPGVSYCYGQPTNASGCPSGVPYAMGRLTSSSNSISTTTYTAYDVHGDVLSSTQMTGSPYPFTYSYNLVGGLKSVQYPSNRKVSYTFDVAARPNSVTGLLNSTTTNYTASGTTVSYAPHGGVSSLTYGNGLQETAGYNAKLQPTQIQAGNLLKLNYCFSQADPACSSVAHPTNNGNLQSQLITTPAVSGSVTQSYTYDGLNRLAQFQESGGAANQSYFYDAFGNRWINAGPFIPYPGQQPRSNTFYNNKWAPQTDCKGNTVYASTGVDYDCAGNQILLGSRSFIYDAENRQAQAVINGYTTAYAYDGDGRRVQKTTGSAATTYVYDAEGRLAAEHIVGLTSITPGTNYLTGDHLGSTRLVTNSSAGPVEQYDYAPFGEELTQGIDGRIAPYSTNSYPTITQDALTEKFTSKERDSETGLDYFGARYFSSAQGRFTSVDPHNDGAQIVDPQSWNGYAYAGNNPLRFKDPDGRDYHLCVDGSCQDVSDAQYNKWRASRGDSIIVEPGGKIRDRETEQVIGSESWFDGDAVRKSENAAAFVNFFALNQGLEMLGGAVEVGVARVAARFAPQIARNAVKGAVAERMVEATLRLKGYKIVGRHVTARTSAGIRYVDYIVERGGEYAAIEVKSGGGIRNAGQLAKDAAMETEGAVIGNNGGALQGQALKLKTIEVRPF